MSSDDPRVTASGWTTASVRALMMAALDDSELDALCLDYFPDVYDKFGRGMRRDEKVNLLLDHVRRHPDDAVRLGRVLPM